jgi:hypothetical protein
MKKLTRDDLMSLEEYSEARDEFRNDVLAHKRNRRLELGTNAALYFEDRLTMQYQVQEMLRIERIFETAGINDELDAYNPLIPDGSNWKATFMIEFPDLEERRAMLQQLRGVEDRVYVRVGDFERVFAIADEDLERADEEKTSAVHFLRFRVPSSPPASTTTATPLKYLRYRKISEILCSAISIKATCRDSCGTRAIRLVHA